MIHCHNDLHADLGMIFTLQVGSPEQMFPVPKDFPRCQTWSPASDMLLQTKGKIITKLLISSNEYFALLTLFATVLGKILIFCFRLADRLIFQAYLISQLLINTATY